MKEEYEEAISNFQEVIKKNPSYAEAHYNLGAAYGRLGRWNEAVEAFKQAIRIKPDYAKTNTRFLKTWIRI